MKPRNYHICTVLYIYNIDISVVTIFQFHQIASPNKMVMERTTCSRVRSLNFVVNTQCFCQPIPSWAMDPVYKVSVKTNETPMHLQHGWRRKAMTVMNSWHIFRPWLTGHLHISGCHCSLSTRNSITKMFIWESLMCAMKKTQYLIFWILLLLIWQITSKILRYARFSVFVPFCVVLTSCSCVL